MGWYDTVRNRYQAAMDVPQEDMIVKLGRFLRGNPDGSSQPAAMPAYQAPYAGLHSSPYGANGLPAFEAPGSSLPMDRYMKPEAAPMTPPAAQPAVTPPPAAVVPSAPAVDAAPPEMPPLPESIPVGMNPAKPDVLAALLQMRRQGVAAPWAVNEGNLKDQIG